MARTSEEIYQSMLASMANYPSLSAISSSSETAIYKRMLRVFAEATNVLEQFFDIQKAELEVIVQSSPFMTDRWLASKALEFQDGDELLVNEAYQLYYSELDEASRVVTVASCITDSFGRALLKVAKGTLGSYEALDSGELARLRAYVSDLKPVGTQISVQSLNADLIKGVFNIYYDASYELTDIESGVASAINEFLVLQPFNGVFRITRMIDAIQAVEGIVDVVVSDIECRADTGSYSSVERIYTPESGYLTLDAIASAFNYIVE